MTAHQDSSTSSSGGTLKLLIWSGFWLGLPSLLYLLAAIDDSLSGAALLNGLAELGAEAS